MKTHPPRKRIGMIVAIAALVLGAVPTGSAALDDGDAPLVGRFVNRDMTVLVELDEDGYTGVIIRGLLKLPFTAQNLDNNLGGQFVYRGYRYGFVAVIEDDALVLRSGGRTYKLERFIVPSPLAFPPDAPEQDVDGQSDPDMPDTKPANPISQADDQSAEKVADAQSSEGNVPAPDSDPVAIEPTPDPSDTLVISDQASAPPATEAAPDPADELASAPDPANKVHFVSLDGARIANIDADGRVHHPLGFSLICPEGWTVRVGPETIMLARSAADGAPELVCNVGLITNTAMVLTRPDEPAFLQQVLGSFTAQSKEFRQVGRAQRMGPTVAVGFVNTNVKVEPPVFGRLHLSVLNQQTACHAFVAGSQEAIDAHAPEVLNAIASVRLAVPDISELGATGGRFAGRFRYRSPRGVCIVTLAQANGEVGGVLVGIHGQKSTITGTIEGRDRFVGVLNFEGAVTHLEGRLDGEHLALTGVPRNPNTGRLDRQGAYTMTYTRLSPTADDERTVRTTETRSDPSIDADPAASEPAEEGLAFEAVEDLMEEGDASQYTQPAEAPNEDPQSPDRFRPSPDESNRDAEHEEAVPSQSSAPPHDTRTPSGETRDQTSLLGRWTDGTVVYEFGEEHLMVYRSERPQDVRIGQLDVEGDRLTVRVGDAAETSRYQLHDRTLTLLLSGGQRVTLRRPG